MKYRKMSSLFMVMVLLVSLMTGCGNAGSGSGAAESPANTAAATNSADSQESEAASEAIRIGVVLPFSGASQYVGEAQYLGYQYALKDFMENYGDQLNGKTIELVTGDSTGVADTGVSEFERMVTSEDISAVIGTYNSGVAAAIAPVAIKYGIPFMVTNAVADNILSENSNYVFRTNIGDADTVPSYIEFLTYLRDDCHMTMDKIAVIYEASDYGQGAHDSLTGNIYPKVGIEVAMEESFTANSGDLSTVINKLKVSGADLVCVVMSENDALLFTRQMVEYGVSMPIIAYGGGFIADNYIEQAGSASESIMSSASYIYDPKAMSADALAIGDDFVANSEYNQVNEAFANGWLGMYTLLEAIASADGSSDSQAIADSLDKIELTSGDRALLFHPTMEGVKYEDDGTRYNQNTYAGMQYGQIQDGAWTLIFPAGENTPEVVIP